MMINCFRHAIIILALTGMEPEKIRNISSERREKLFMRVSSNFPIIKETLRLCFVDSPLH